MTRRVNGATVSVVARTALAAAIGAGVILAGAFVIGGCTASGPPGGATQSKNATPAEVTFRVPDSALPTPLVMVAYGDMRFTDPSELAATSPSARQALVAKVAAEHPAAIFLNGDVPWHGKSADYEAFRAETQIWRTEKLRVYPALGNHEFSQCELAQCLDYWWTAFPELRDRRWYSVAVGSKVLGLALDTDTSLLPGSDQRIWLEQQIAGLDKKVRVVLIVLHHPPVADLATGLLSDHNPRPNEESLAAYLNGVAPTLHAHILVSAGHIHNYERFEQSGVTYLVSGGGGAKPYDVVRTPADLYQRTEFPNYHYVRLELQEDRLAATMIRLANPGAAAPPVWEVADRFDLSLQP
jgi:hypothetical protein